MTTVADIYYVDLEICYVDLEKQFSRRKEGFNRASRTALDHDVHHQGSQHVAWGVLEA